MKNEVKSALIVLFPFVSKLQMVAMAIKANGKEDQFFQEKIVELAAQIKRIPAYDGKDSDDDSQIAYLRYEAGPCEWLVLKSDPHGERAFGFVNLAGEVAALGYFSVTNLVESGVSLDLGFEPVALKHVLSKLES